MAIPYLPTEIVEQIVSHLASMKIWRFDNARKRDLQSLRLVSHRIMAVTTPFLFRDLRIDNARLLTMTPFCSRHPELAKYVQGLQLVMTLGPHAGPFIRARDNAQRIMEEIKSQNKEHADIFFNIILEPFAKLLDKISGGHEDVLPALEKLDSCLDKVCEELLALATVLPDLTHFEVMSSKRCSAFLTNGAEAFYNQTGRTIHSMELDDEFLELENGYTGFLGGYIVARCKIAQSYKCDYLSLRVCSYISAPEVREYFSNLDTLDLGFTAFMLTGRESKNLAHAWIPLLNRLVNLSTLRLVLTHSMEHVHAAPYCDGHKLFLDDLFLDYDLVPADHDERYIWDIVAKLKLPKLKSVTLKNWAVGASILHYFLYAHKKTLKRIHMEKVSLRSPCLNDRRGWSFIARACREHLPGLEDLRLSGLYSHEKLNYGLTAPPAATAVIKVRKLQAEEMATLRGIAFGNSDDRERGTGSEVEEGTEPVSPEAEWWWPGVSGR